MYLLFDQGCLYAQKFVALQKIHQFLASRLLSFQAVWQSQHLSSLLAILPTRFSPAIDMRSFLKFWEGTFNAPEDNTIVTRQGDICPFRPERKKRKTWSYLRTGPLTRDSLSPMLPKRCSRVQCFLKRAFAYTGCFFYCSFPKSSKSQII